MKRKVVFIIVAAAVLLFSQCAAKSQYRDFLFGHWTFDEGEGNIVGDVSGLSVNGTIAGNPVWNKEGKVKGSIVFDGEENYVSIPGQFYMPEYTMTIWAKPELRFSHQDIISAYADGIRHGVLVELRDEGVMRYLHRFPLGESGGVNIYTDGTYNDAQWHHIAVVKSPQEIVLYIDGIIVGQEPETSIEPGEVFDVVLGVLDTQRGMRFFKGEMDDFRMYNLALTEEDVLTLMQESIEGIK